MISREILRQVVTQQKARIAKGGDFIGRTIFDEVSAAMDDDRVIILTGIRRCGKSTLLMQLMQARNNVCYVNFEDERFLSFRAEDFSLLDEVLIEIYGPATTYFFDEIQNVEKFETFVRRLQDNGKKIVITGSTASLLSAEFGTRLTGRHKRFEIFPFSFAEYLRFTRISVTRETVQFAEGRALLMRAFGEFLADGGMPEYLRNHDSDYLRTLYDNILYRDIIARHSIRRQRLVRELVAILSSSISLPFTYNSLKKTLGLMNAITVKEYISYLGGAYLFFELLRFDYSVKRQLGAPRKIFIIDTAISALTGFSLSPDRGRLLENLVFIELKRRGGELYYFAKNGECDFVIREKRSITRAIQVCHEITDSNREREIGGLMEALEEFDLPEGFILTYDQEEVMVREVKTIRVQPVWKWMLEGSFLNAGS